MIKAEKYHCIDYQNKEGQSVLVYKIEELTKTAFRKIASSFNWVKSADQEHLKAMQVTKERLLEVDQKVSKKASQFFRKIGGSQVCQALQKAIDEKDTVKIGQLFQFGDFSLQSSSVQSKLFKQKDVEVLKALLDQGLDPNFLISRKKNISLLYKYAESNQLEAVSLLISRGALLDYENNSQKETALHIAARKVILRLFVFYLKVALI